MAIGVQVNGAIGLMSMSGRFDFQVHREFKDAYTRLLEDDAVREIQLEMDKLEYLDSSALGMLLLLNERARPVGKSVTLLNPSGMVAQVLEVANFDKLFDIRKLR
jgi:anti-anti-sigma factor